jgi:hypothetical protein
MFRNVPQKLKMPNDHMNLLHAVQNWKLNAVHKWWTAVNWRDFAQRGVSPFLNGNSWFVKQRLSPPCFKRRLQPWPACVVLSWDTLISVLAEHLLLLPCHRVGAAEQNGEPILIIHYYLTDADEPPQYNPLIAPKTLSWYNTNITLYIYVIRFIRRYRDAPHQYNVYSPIPRSV